MTRVSLIAMIVLFAGTAAQAHEPEYETDARHEHFEPLIIGECAYGHIVLESERTCEHGHRMTTVFERREYDDYDRQERDDRRDYDRRPRYSEPEVIGECSNGVPIYEGQDPYEVCYRSYEYAPAPAPAPRDSETIIIVNESPEPRYDYYDPSWHPYHRPHRGYGYYSYHRDPYVSVGGTVRLGRTPVWVQLDVPVSPHPPVYRTRSHRPPTRSTSRAHCSTYSSRAATDGCIRSYRSGAIYRSHY